MIHIPLAQVLLAHLQSLISNGVREGKSIEYKLELPGNSDADKKEFLADISSFANAGGGDILYGVTAINGLPMSLPGLTGFDEDKERLRLESTIRDGVDPRIPGVQLAVIPGGMNGPVLIIRVPRSWNGPHMVTFKGASRFHSRSSAGKFQMDVNDIRLAFETSADIPKRIQQWRDERLGRIIANEGPIHLEGQGILVVHLIPLESLANPLRFQASDLHGGGLFFPPLGSSGYNPRFNLDGLLTYVPRNNGATSSTCYCQVFRSGAIEGVYSDLLREKDGTAYIGSIHYEKIVIQAVHDYLKAMKKLGVLPPLLFTMAVLQAKGAYLYADAWRFGGEIHSIDRETLILPEVIFEDFENDITATLRPVFDAVWNASGLAKSWNYNEDGQWAPRN